MAGLTELAELPLSSYIKRFERIAKQSLVKTMPPPGPFLNARVSQHYKLLGLIPSQHCFTARWREGRRQVDKKGDGVGLGQTIVLRMGVGRVVGGVGGRSRGNCGRHGRDCWDHTHKICTWGKQNGYVSRASMAPRAKLPRVLAMEKPATPHMWQKVGQAQGTQSTISH